MTLPTYDETLKRFELEQLRDGLDLQLTPSGDIAPTRDGDLAMGDAQGNAFFRLVQRWRQSKSTVDELFAAMAAASTSLNSLNADRAASRGPQLWQTPQAFHDVTDQMLEYQSVSAVLAGAIFVVLNNLLHRFSLDLNVSAADWAQAGPSICNRSLGEVVAAAAANFRHHDEWASTNGPPTRVQLPSMAVISDLLHLPTVDAHGYPTIRTNVCAELLMMVSEGSSDGLHEATFAYAKALAHRLQAA